MIMIIYFYNNNNNYYYINCYQKEELEALSEIARSHAAYTVFTKGYNPSLLISCAHQSRLKIFEDYVDPIQEAIDDLLLPTLFGQREPLPNDLRRVVTLTPAKGGLGVPD